MSHLFSPWQLGAMPLPNRIVVAPMCQYSAEEGNATDWHLMHLGQLALSGASLLVLEATAVEAEGRITAGDLGLYSDDNEAALARVLKAVRTYSPIKVSVQLAHAGRKASSHTPWQGGQQVRSDQPNGWQTEGPSAVPHDATDEPPLALDAAGLARIRDAFAQAAKRAARLGLDGIEIHSAHGYLLHEFLSPISNKRTDAYGGSLENRMRFPLEVFDAVHAAVPADMPVWVRVSATDWTEGGWDVESTIAFCNALKARGCAAVDVSSGGVSTQQQIQMGPGYQVGLARAVRAGTGLPTIAVGLITETAQAEAILADGDADAIALGRGLLFDPRWPWRAALELGAQVQGPPQYWRSMPQGVKDLFVGARIGRR